MTIHLGDCVQVMAGMEPDSIDAIVTDPPYGLEFMGKEWDRLETGAGYQEKPRFNEALGFGGYRKRPNYYQSGKTAQEWHERWATEALRVAKPGAYLLAFGGTRTVHRLTCALEDAGWIIRDMLVWAYASGFPKSKASLKPAWEPIVHRPASRDRCGCWTSTGAGSRARWTGRGALVNCRPSATTAPKSPSTALRSPPVDGPPTSSSPTPSSTAAGMAWWEGERRGRGATSPRRSANTATVHGPRMAPLTASAPTDRLTPATPAPTPASSSSPRRPAATASRRCRGTSSWGCPTTPSTAWSSANAGLAEAVAPAQRRNTHPTVKSTALMRHLVRLVTPQGGTVLDPFLAAAARSWPPRWRASHGSASRGRRLMSASQSNGWSRLSKGSALA